MDYVSRLKQELKNQLKRAKKIVIIGVGSELRGDDIAGLIVVRELESINNSKRIKVFSGATAPENFIGKISRFRPTHLVIIDSADMHEQPGTIRIIDREKISGFSFCTHQLPLKMMADYISEMLGCHIFIIGIQPASLGFGKSPSKEVEDAARQTAKLLKDVVR